MDDQCDNLKRDCLIRIRDLRLLLDHIELIVKKDHGILNSLGELQGVPGILDCRLASLAVVRKIRDDDPIAEICDGDEANA